MDEKYNEATTRRPQGDRTVDAPLISIDLGSFIEQIRNEKTWEDSDRNAITVFKTNGMRIVLIALHKNAALARHTANGIISVQVLEGQMIFTTDQQSVELSKGQLLTLHQGIPHSIVAIEETVFLLTLTTTLAPK